MSVITPEVKKINIDQKEKLDLISEHLVTNTCDTFEEECFYIIVIRTTRKIIVLSLFRINSLYLLVLILMWTVQFNTIQSFRSYMYTLYDYENLPQESATWRNATPRGWTSSQPADPCALMGPRRSEAEDRCSPTFGRWWQEGSSFSYSFTGTPTAHVSQILLF